MIIVLTNPTIAEAHFFGGVTKDLADGYQIIFVPFPDTPKAGDNSTRLNFSVLKDGQNVVAVFVALIIKQKSSGTIEQQFPYKFYEFSDITIQYAFKKAMNYDVIIEARVKGDPKYEANPFIADFDIRVKDPNDILSDNPPLIGGIGVGVAIAAIIGVYSLRKQRKSKEKARRYSK